MTKAIGVAFLACVAAIHATIAWLSPLQNDDWSHLLWSRSHDRVSTGAWLADFAATHYTFSDLVGFAIAHSTLLHAIATPLAGIALLVGLFTLAARRLPRLSDAADVLALVAISALVWIAAPRAGLVFFHRPYAAQWLYGAAVTAWVLVPYRLGWTPRRGWLALFILGALCAGTSARQLATPALIVALVAVVRTRPRPRWMIAGAIALAIGTLAIYLDSPRVDFRGFKPGFEASLAQLNLSINEGGELVSLVLGLVMVKLLLSRVRPAWGGLADPPDTSDTLRWLAIWLGVSILALFGPQYSEATLFPTALVLVVAAYPYVTWLTTSRPLRLALVAIVVAIHLVAWTMALAKYISIGAQFRGRIAKLEAAPPGSVVVLPPYSQVEPTFWFIGEDWADNGARQLAAIDLFGLADIDLSPGFRRLDPNPRLRVHLDTDGVSPEQLRAAEAPALWATEPTAARSQLDGLVNRLVDALGPTFALRLVADDVEFAERKGRPVYVGWYDHGTKRYPKVATTQPDDANRQLVRAPSLGTEEVYVVHDGKATPVVRAKGGYYVKAANTNVAMVVACEPTRCLLVDAFIPRM
ncbi:MAG TPA: DUF6056 family protein [Kofleriaceae bacterium]|nr:DUF6056 family protein [Kofleriaceae bacterium]